MARVQLDAVPPGLAHDPRRVDELLDDLVDVALVHGSWRAPQEAAERPCDRERDGRRRESRRRRAAAAQDAHRLAARVVQLDDGDGSRS